MVLMSYILLVISVCLSLFFLLALNELVFCCWLFVFVFFLFAYFVLFFKLPSWHLSHFPKFLHD